MVFTDFFLRKWRITCFFVFLLCPQHWKFPRQGSNPCHSSSPSHCSDSTGSLTGCATRELRNALFEKQCYSLLLSGSPLAPWPLCSTESSYCQSAPGARDMNGNLDPLFKGDPNFILSKEEDFIREDHDRHRVAIKTHCLCRGILPTVSGFSFFSNTHFSQGAVVFCFSWSSKQKSQMHILHR